MSLIDHFNAFQVVSETNGLTPNARSLYFAILAEFNRQRFPASAKILNGYLQQLSGITSNSSFDAARTALINAGAIHHKKNIYELKTGNVERKPIETVSNSVENSMENQCNSVGKPMENLWKTDGKSLGLLSIPTNEEERERERDVTTTTTPTARASEILSRPSDEVNRAWLLSEGVNLKGGNAQDFAYLENYAGTEALVMAINDARRSNREHVLNFNYVCAVMLNHFNDYPIKDRQRTAALLEQRLGKPRKKAAAKSKVITMPAVYSGDDDLPEG